MKIDPIPAIKIDPIPSIEKDTPIRKAPSGKNIKKIIKYGLVLAAIFALFNIDAITDYYTVQAYDGDGRLVAMADQAGLNLNGKAMFLSKSPELVNANQLYEHCPRENGALGCYVPDEDKVYILNLTSQPYSKAMPSTVAHETLHVAWGEMSSDQRSEISTELKSHLKQEKDKYTKLVKKSLADYEKSDDVQINEAHSFIGSQLFERNTSDVLNHHFREYFSNRDKSAQSNADYVDSINETSDDLDKRSADLKKQLKKIKAYEARWLRPFDYALERDRYYGNYSSYNTNVKRYNGNLETYNQLLDTYESDRLSLNADINKFNNAMKEIQPDKQVKKIKNKAVK